MMFVITALVFFCDLSVAISADHSCGSNCIQDETSLVQVKYNLASAAKQQQPEVHTITKTVTITSSSESSDDWSDYSNLTSGVEDAQNSVKSAASQSAIAKYAEARANQNKIKAFYNSAKASYAAEDKDFDSTEAGRAARKALRYAFDETQAWKKAVAAANVTAVNLANATGDYEGKYAVSMNTSQQAEDATQRRIKAQENATNVRIEAQAEVDRALAGIDAKKAYEAKVAAAAAVAKMKAQNQAAAAANKNFKAQQKLAGDRAKDAANTELKAHAKAMDAQWKTMQAEAASVDAALDPNATLSLAEMEPSDNDLTLMQDAVEAMDQLQELVSDIDETGKVST